MNEKYKIDYSSAPLQPVSSLPKAKKEEEQCAVRTIPLPCEELRKRRAGVGKNEIRCLCFFCVSL